MWKSGNRKISLPHKHTLGTPLYNEMIMRSSDFCFYNQEESCTYIPHVWNQNPYQPAKLDNLANNNDDDDNLIILLSLDNQTTIAACFEQFAIWAATYSHKIMSLDKFIIEAHLRYPNSLRALHP